MATANKAVTWIPVWMVTADGETLTEWRASIRDRSATVRRWDQTRGGEAWNRAYFDQLFGTSPKEALVKFITRQRVIAGKAKEELATAERRIDRAQVLALAREAH